MTWRIGLKRRDFLSRAAAPLPLSAGVLMAAPLAAQDHPAGLDEGAVSDPEQAELSGRGQALREYVLAHHRGDAGSVQAAIAGFETRFRSRGSSGWVRKRIASSASLRLPADGDRAFLQAISDYNALWFGTSDVPAGLFRLDDSLFVTHGLAFPWSTGRLVGAGLNFDGSDNFRGTTLVLTRTDRPAVICQGGRKDRIADLTIVGPLRRHIFERNLGTAATRVDDSNPAAWDAPGIADRRWAPLAGIAVDPLADTPPPQPYPSLPTPAYLGPGRQYGRQVTSDVLIERVQITGFNVGLVVHPASGVSQGDYVHARDLTIEACKYGVSIGNTQSRLPTAVHRHIARVYCGFTNRVHGAQQGFFAGTETSPEVGSCIKVFDFDLSHLGNFTFDGLYTEACWYTGDLRGSTALDGILTIRGGHLNQSYASGDYVARRGVPKYIIGDPTRTTGYAGTGQVALENTFLSFRTACPLMVANLSLSRVQLYSLEAASTAPNLARAIAHNGSMGLLMPPGARPSPAIVSAPRFDLATLGPDRAHTTDDNFRETDRAALIPWFVRRARPRTHHDDRFAVDVPLWQVSVPAGNYALRWQRGIEVHLSHGLTRDEASNAAQAPGCLVLHDLDGRWYYIKSRDDRSRAVVLEALGDYHDPGSGKVLRSPYVGRGTLHFVETRFYTPPAALIGDTREGSGTIANLRTTGGQSAGPAPGIEPGDYLWVDPDIGSPMFGRSGNRVTAVDPGARTVTLSGPALRAQQGFRLGLLIRGT